MTIMRLILIIFINLFVLNGLPIIGLSATLPTPTQGIIIATDQTEYKLGVSVKISVTNNFDIPIWYAKRVDCGASFWLLESCENKEVTYYSVCDWFGLQHKFTKFNPKETLQDEWDGRVLDQKDYNYQLKIAEPGCYKIVFPYSTKEKQAEIGETWGWDMLKVYSNEFIIKRSQK